MANYVTGLGGNCCVSCTPDDPCAKKPEITLCNTDTGTVGVTGFWAPFLSATDISGATWTLTSGPTGSSINPTSGYVSWTPTGAGTYYFGVTATKDCGTASCIVTVVVSGAECPECAEIIFYEADLVAGGATESFSYDVTGLFVCDKPFHFEWGFFEGEDDGCGRAVLKANGSTIYDTGCICATSGSVELTMPAGTVTISLEVIGCDAYGCSYSVGGNCYEP